MRKRFGHVRTRNLVAAVLHASRFVPSGALLNSRRALGRLLYAHGSLRRQVHTGMAAALGPDAVPDCAVRSYFEHVADLVAFSVLTLRHGFAASGLEDEFVPEESQEIMRRALAGGRGILLIGPHLVCHELGIARLNQFWPVVGIIRHSADPVHERRKLSWYGATGIRVVYRPGPDGGSELREMAAALGALRENRMLGINADLLQEPGKGVVVRLFGREACLPPGPAFLALRTGAPLIPCFHWKDGDRYRLYCEEPVEIPSTRDREEAVRAGMQEWARRFERFIARHPDMWLFWLDKRWAAWLRQPARSYREGAE
jgi:lauroyl/myristoyl acyltransferase